MCASLNPLSRVPPAVCPWFNHQVDIEYTKGKEIVVRKGDGKVGAIAIGRIPLMLRCDRCVQKQLPCVWGGNAMLVGVSVSVWCIGDGKVGAIAIGSMPLMLRCDRYGRN